MKLFKVTGSFPTLRHEPSQVGVRCWQTSGLLSSPGPSASHVAAGNGESPSPPFPWLPGIWPIQRNAKAHKKCPPFIMGRFSQEMFPGSAENLPGDLVTSCSQPTQWARPEQCRVGKTSRLSIGSQPPGTPPHPHPWLPGLGGGVLEDAKASVEEGKGGWKQDQISSGWLHPEPAGRVRLEVKSAYSGSLVRPENHGATALTLNQIKP